MVLGRVGEGSGIAGRLQGHDRDETVPGKPEAGEPARGLGRREGARRQRSEEVALQPALRLGDRSRLRELDCEQREGVARHDPVDLRERLRRADGQEGLDPPLSSDRLDPYVLILVDEREAEADPLRPRGLELLPDPTGSLPRDRRGRCQRHPVEVDQQDPPTGHTRERGRDAVDPAPLHDGAGQNVLGVDRALEHVVLLREQPGEHGLRERDERNRVRDLEQGEPGLFRRGDEGPRHLVEAEPEPEPEPGQTRLREALQVAPLPGRGGADPVPRGQEDLAPLEPRRGVLELGDVHPPDRASDVRLPGDQPEREPGYVQDVADGEGHDPDCTNGTDGRPSAPRPGRSGWTGRTNEGAGLGTVTA